MGNIVNKAYQLPGGPKQIEVTFYSNDGRCCGSTYVDTQEQAEEWRDAMSKIHDVAVPTAPHI